MGRHLTNKDGKIPFTSEQEAAQDALEAQAALDAPLQNWYAAMAASDVSLPRYVEDIFDALPGAQQSNAAAETRNKIAAKKTLRANRP